MKERVKGIFRRDEKKKTPEAEATEYGYHPGNPEQPKTYDSVGISHMSASTATRYDQIPSAWSLSDRKPEIWLNQYTEPVELDTDTIKHSKPKAQTEENSNDQKPPKRSIAQIRVYDSQTFKDTYLLAWYQCPVIQVLLNDFSTEEVVYSAPFLENQEAKYVGSMVLPNYIRINSIFLTRYIRSLHNELSSPSFEQTITITRPFQVLAPLADSLEAIPAPVKDSGKGKGKGTPLVQDPATAANIAAISSSKMHQKSIKKVLSQAKSKWRVAWNTETHTLLTILYHRKTCKLTGPHHIKCKTPSR